MNDLGRHLVTASSSLFVGPSTYITDNSATIIGCGCYTPLKASAP